jgi:hypothetical protein
MLTRINSTNQEKLHTQSSPGVIPRPATSPLSLSDVHDYLVEEGSDLCFKHLEARGWKNPQKWVQVKANTTTANERVSKSFQVGSTDLVVFAAAVGDAELGNKQRAAFVEMVRRKSGPSYYYSSWPREARVRFIVY